MAGNLGETLESRYQSILKKIHTAQSKSPWKNAVTLIAVSKGQSVDSIEALYRVGQRDFGENYVQELLKKAAALEVRGCQEIRWHFIGHLQSNKVKLLIPKVYAIHSLDSERLVLSVSKEANKQYNQRKIAQPLPIFVEVNIANEASKSGLAPSEVVTVVKKLSECSDIQIQGLMCVPPAGGDSSDYFSRLRKLESECRPVTHGALSMGMSDDFEVAIREGATHVRVGTAIFGARGNFS